MGQGDQDSVNATAWGRQVALDVGGASPPVNAYITQDDVLQVSINTSLSGTLSFTINARILLPSGEIKLNVWPATCTFPGTAVRLALPEGFLLSLVVICNNQIPNNGWAYCVAQLVFGTTATAGRTQVLFSGYMSIWRLLGWPGGALEAPTAGRGLCRAVTVANPAIGAEFSTSVPSNTQWRLQSLVLFLTTSLNVANRVIHLVIDDGSNQIANIPMSGSQAASNSFAYTWMPISGPIAVADFAGLLPIPDNLVIPSGFRIRTQTSNMQGNDQYSAIALMVEEWGLI